MDPSYDTAAVKVHISGPRPDDAIAALRAGIHTLMQDQPLYYRISVVSGLAALLAADLCDLHCGRDLHPFPPAATDEDPAL